MKLFKRAQLITAVALAVFALMSKQGAYEAKADAAAKNQPSVSVRSASLTSDKVIKVPAKTVQKSNSGTSTKNSLSRGGSGISSAGPTAPEGSNNVVTYAYKFLGKPYVWGATGPSAFDCSGFTTYVYKNFDVSLPRTSSGQYGSGQTVSKANLAQGDLVFFNTYGSISHVGIYIGDGRFIHAGSSKTGVVISSIGEGYYASRYVGAKRVLQ
jgi:cell wall-associated NlpC family hydrolase